MIDTTNISIQTALDIEFARRQKGNLDEISAKINNGQLEVSGYLQFQISQSANAIECLLRNFETIQREGQDHHGNPK